MNPTYVTNVRAAVRVNGRVQIFEASTRLPDGVEASELERLLRFGVIRVEEPLPAPVPAEEPERSVESEAAPERAAVSTRARKKSAATEE